MENPWEFLNPKDYFSVQLSGNLTETDRKHLSFLYQPLIGATAYSLYTTLWTEIDNQRYVSEPLLHSELLMLLNISIPELYQARVKLEGIGLIRTFKHKTEGNYIYELLAPLDSAQFFGEDLLSMMLFETVGERKYRSLKQRFSVAEIDTVSYQDQTKSFLDVYRFSHKMHRSMQENAHNQMIGKAKTHVPQVDQKTFDWVFFYEGLAKQYVRREDVTSEIEQLILVLHEMYGVDELAMQRFVSHSTEMNTGSIDARKLKKNVYDAYHQNNPAQVSIYDVVGKELADNQGKELFRKNELRHQGFTDEDIQLIHQAQQYPLYDFINNIKKQKGGFVSKTETWILDSLVQQSRLPTAVINILIHYLLVAKGDVTLTQGLTDKIANDWAQGGITTPEKAMQKVQQSYEDTAQKIQDSQSKKSGMNQRNTYNQKNQTIRKETLPEWAKESAIVREEKPLSAEKQAAIKEKLRKIQNFGKEGDI